MFRDRNRVDVADNRHGDAALGAERERHVVVADPVARHDLQIAGSRKRLGGQRRIPDRDRVGVGDVRRDGGDTRVGQHLAIR